MIPFHYIDLPSQRGVSLAVGGGRVVPCEYVSTWNGRDLSDPEPHRRHAPPTEAAALPADPEVMVRHALAIRQMSAGEMARHFGVSSAVFARVLARLQDAGEVRVRFQRVAHHPGMTRLVKVYRLASGVRA